MPLSTTHASLPLRSAPAAVQMGPRSPTAAACPELATAKHPAPLAAQCLLVKAMQPAAGCKLTKAATNSNSIITDATAAAAGSTPAEGAPLLKLGPEQANALSLLGQPVEPLLSLHVVGAAAAHAHTQQFVAVVPLSVTQTGGGRSLSLEVPQATTSNDSLNSLRKSTVGTTTALQSTTALKSTTGTTTGTTTGAAQALEPRGIQITAARTLESRGIQIRLTECSESTVDTRALEPRAGDELPYHGKWKPRSSRRGGTRALSAGAMQLGAHAALAASGDVAGRILAAHPDSGASGSLTPHLQLRANVRDCSETFVTASGDKAKATKIGDLPFTATDSDGALVTGSFRNVRWVPSFTFTLLSVKQLWREQSIDTLFADVNALVLPFPSGERRRTQLQVKPHRQAYSVHPCLVLHCDHCQRHGVNKVGDLVSGPCAFAVSTILALTSFVYRTRLLVRVCMTLGTTRTVNSAATAAPPATQRSFTTTYVSTASFR